MSERPALDFAAALAQAALGIGLVRGPQHTIVFANAALTRVTGGCELSGRTLAESPLAHWPGLIEQVEETDRTKEPATLRKLPVVGRRSHDTDELLFLDVICQPIRDPLGGSDLIMLTAVDVTEQVRSEEALRATHETAESILSVLGDGFVAFDENIRVTRINAAALKFDGRDESEIVGKTHWEAWPTSVGSFLEEAYKRCVAEQVQVSIERRYTGFGKDRWLELRLCPVPGGVVSFYRDITERKNAEDAVRASEERFRALVEAVPHHVWEAGPDGTIEWINGRFYEFTGADLRELGDEAWRGVVEPDDRDHLLESWREALRTGSIYEGEVRLRRASDQTYRWFLSKGVPVRDPDGRVVRWIGTNTDIHEQKVAARQLADLNASLEERVTERTRERDRMWRLSTDLMLVADLSGRIVALNPAWGATLARDDRDLLGTALADLVHPDDRSGLHDMVERLSQTQSTSGFQTRLRHADRSYRWIAWTAVPDEHFIHAVGRDITAETEARQALLEAEEALRQSQKMEAVGQLTGGIAHDFNNLLTGITASIDLIQTRIAQGRTGEIARFAEAAMASAARAAALTHRLLAFSRRQPLDPKPVDANQLIASMHELLRRTTSELVDVRLQSTAGLWLTLCDPHQLENALLNLVINARDAMPDGGAITIETRNVELDEAYVSTRLDVVPGPYVAVSVADTGSGMSKDVLARAFEPFFTTKPIGQGTGLGLSMVYGFVRQSGGHLSISSELGVGTTVTIHLPRHLGPDEQDAAPALPASGSRARSDETVLVVEDDPVVRELVVEMLHDLGYHVVEAADGPEGLRIVESKQPIALLLTDVGLPGLNGRQLADAARQHRPDLKVLFMTGYVEHSLLAKGFLGPDMEVITKPFALDALASRIGLILPRR